MIAQGIFERLPAPRLNHGLAVAAILFAALAVWPWFVPPTPKTRPLAASPTSVPTPTLAALPPLASFSEIIERPLFTPSRRPPAGAASMQAPSIETRYRLLGVVATGPKKKAFIAEGAHRLEISIGDALEGWTVKEIGPDHVLLGSPAGEATLKLAPAAPEAQKPQ